MPKLKVLVGPPGSGKSTACKPFQGVRISQDEQGKENHMILFHAAIANGKDIVVDRMNFDKKQRARYIVPAKEKGYEIEIFLYHVPRQTCFLRASARKDHPTIKDAETAWKAINYFFAHYEAPTPDEGKIFLEGEADHKGTAIICDLDGTLCNIDHRLHFVRNKPKNWPAFFNGIGSDKPNEWCVKLINGMRQLNYSLIFCSGRGEEYRKVTEDWLIRHGFNGQYKLFMRSAGDSRPDDLIKEIILDFDILPHYKPLFAIDDRQRVVDMWRRRGITTLQCAKGDF